MAVYPESRVSSPSLTPILTLTLILPLALTPPLSLSLSLALSLSLSRLGNKKTLMLEELGPKAKGLGPGTQ